MLQDQYTVKRWGDLVILDVTDQGLRRMVKVARLTVGVPSYVLELVDPHIIWASGESFVLAGFERMRNEQGQLVDYAQSWLCTVSFDGRDEAAGQGKREEKRAARAVRS
jgi:hypothetical protein